MAADLCQLKCLTYRRTVLYDLMCAHCGKAVQWPWQQRFVLATHMLDPHTQIAASPEASYVSVEEVPKEFVDSETSIEMQKDDILSKPENIRCADEYMRSKAEHSSIQPPHGCPATNVMFRRTCK
jgi:DNA-binding transcriptional regulator of glucitol operon